MKLNGVDQFEKLSAQLDGLYQEIFTLSKKSPNDAVNIFKINLINALISKCNSFFGEKYRPFADFEIFSTDDVPSNSDVSFVISQYIECAEKFRADNVTIFNGRWYWDVEDYKKDDEKLRTSPPKKLGYK